MTRSLRRGLLMLGWLLFAASLPLPAVIADGGWGHDRVSSGLACLLSGIQFYPSNFLLILSAWIAWRMSHSRTTAFTRGVMVGCYTLSTALVLSTWGWTGLRGHAAGYYLWLVAHSLVAAGFWIPPPASAARPAVTS
jgi:hypothetical protein